MTKTICSYITRLAEAALLPLRHHDPAALAWLQAAYDRPDVQDLYLHGSRLVFRDRFPQPPLDRGRLIFTSKLLDHRQHSIDKVLQAEHYGPNLHLVKLAKGTFFNPYSDPKAKAIMAETLTGVWDYDSKVKYGRLDYQDCHLVVPAAVEAGYDRFEVYECSIMSVSYAVAYPEMVEIVDVYEGDRA